MQRAHRKNSTIHTTSQKLNQITRATDITNPQAVQSYIDSLDVKNSTKSKMSKSYAYFATTNQIPYKTPHYDVEEYIPIVPSKENVTKIIAAASRRYTTIFTLLAETAIEGEELHCSSQKCFDLERGIFSVIGHKKHDSGVYTLKPATLAMVREYMLRNPQEYPFPDAKDMSDAWRKYRNRLADQLKQPELKKIEMKLLRNYSGAQMYYKTGNILLVKKHMRHKKMETTYHYIQSLDLSEEPEYCHEIALDVQQAGKLIDAGYEYVTGEYNDGGKLFRKRK